MAMKLHHIGIAAGDMEELVSYVTALFPVRDTGKTIYDPLQDAFLRMLLLEDGSRMELVSGPIVEKRVKKRQLLYHTCYETKDLAAAVEAFVQKGAFLISEPKPAVLFEGRKVAFLMTELGILELLEQKGTEERL